MKKKNIQKEHKKNVDNDLSNDANDSDDNDVHHRSSSMTGGSMAPCGLVTTTVTSGRTGLLMSRKEKRTERGEKGEKRQ